MADRPSDHPRVNIGAAGWRIVLLASLGGTLEFYDFVIFGILLSHYGDRYGRRRVFLLSLFVMSGATLGMGLVPTHASWGLAASALMVVLRLVQGFCLGGELPGALTYVVETAPRQAPFVCGVVFACVTMGVAAATGVSLGVCGRGWIPPTRPSTAGGSRSSWAALAACSAMCSGVRWKSRPNSRA
jgi:MFS family permease